MNGKLRKNRLKQELGTYSMAIARISGSLVKTLKICSGNTRMLNIKNEIVHTLMKIESRIIRGTREYFLAPIFWSISELDDMVIAFANKFPTIPILFPIAEMAEMRTCRN